MSSVPCQLLYTREISIENAGINFYNFAGTYRDRKDSKQALSLSHSGV